MNRETSRSGSEVEFTSDTARVRGFLFESDTTEPAPGLVLIPDVHGVSPLYREIAGSLAEAGFHTLVLDIYSREGAPRLADMAEVQSWIADLPDARVLADIDAATRSLKNRAAVRRDAVGIVGFCLGGQFALMAASRNGALAACVAFYGMLRHGKITPHKLPPPIETAAAIRCPVLGLFGAEDPLITQTDVDDLRSALERSTQPHEVHVFPGAGHAFMNDRRPDAYRPETARQAMRRTIEFLRETLR